MSNVHCTQPGCDAVVGGIPDHPTTPDEVYDALRRVGWNPAPALCTEHSNNPHAVYDRMPAHQRRSAVAFLIEQGRHIEDLPNSWTTEDAFQTIESLIEAYQAFIAPHEAGNVACTCGNTRHPEGEK